MGESLLSPLVLLMTAVGEYPYAPRGGDSECREIVESNRWRTISREFVAASWTFGESAERVVGCSSAALRRLAPRPSRMMAKRPGASGVVKGWTPPRGGLVLAPGQSRRRGPGANHIRPACPSEPDMYSNALQCP